MGLTWLRTLAIGLSVALALALLFAPYEGRGLQAELFASLAFFLLAAFASTGPSRRLQPRR
ncbi:MAG: hypothetical protein JWN48_5629 [Myxococcaceae bacterium]|nr:hypothetical protein [Myxococcaceae bacterium]